MSNQTRPASIFGWYNLYQKSWPTKVKGLCKRIGVKCVAKPLDDGISGYIEKLRDGSYKITYNANHQTTRQRFTIAHELGHFYLHRHVLGNGTGDNKAYRSEVKGYENPEITAYMETEANAFAADLLMPKDLICEWVDDGKSFAEIREKLNVSAKALEFRYKNLGLKKYLTN